jgi:hypothetical protein
VGAVILMRFITPFLMRKLNLHKMSAKVNCLTSMKSTFGPYLILKSVDDDVQIIGP